MPLTRGEVLDQALDILDAYGFADLSMRRLAGALGVQPGALYWHFANKQTLLLALAERILAGVGGPNGRTDGDWERAVRDWADGFRDALLAHRDGAELVASVLALRPAGEDPARVPVAPLRQAGLGPEEADAAAHALLHYVVGHTVDAQTNAQAGELGVTDGEDRSLVDRRFAVGLELFLGGVRSWPSRTRPGPPEGAGDAPDPERSRR